MSIINYEQAQVGDHLGVWCAHPNGSRSYFEGRVAFISAGILHDSDGRSFPFGTVHRYEGEPVDAETSEGDFVRTVESGHQITAGLVERIDPLLGPVDVAGEPLLIPGTQAFITRSI